MSGILLDRYLLFYRWKYWDLEVKFTRIINMPIIEQELEAEMSAIFNTVLLTATLVVHNHFFKSCIIPHNISRISTEAHIILLKYKKCFVYFSVTLYVNCCVKLLCPKMFFYLNLGGNKFFLSIFLNNQSDNLHDINRIC